MEEIGRRLQAARLAKELTLQHVEDETRIRKKYIEALESGRVAVIPGEVYVKGFLRTYGNYLGLDGEGLVEEYKHLQAPAPEQGPAPGEVTGNERPAVQAEPAVPRPAERKERPPRRPATTGARPAAPTTYMFRRMVVALAILIPLTGLAWWLYGQMTAEPKTVPPPAVTQKEDPPPKPPEPKPEPKPEPPKPTVTMTGPKGEAVDFAVSVSPVVVQLEGFREGFPWMQVWVDGKEVFQGKPTAPVKYEGKEVTIRAGFMLGVDMVVNGEKFAEPLKGGPYTIKLTGK